MKISDILIKEDKPIKEAMKLIDRAGLCIAFVVDKNNTFLGVVTDGDIRRAILEGTSLNAPVKKVMNTTPIIAKKGWTEDQVKRLLQSHEIHDRIPEHGMMRIPVLDNEKHVVDLIFATADSVSNGLPKKDQIHKVKQVNRVLVVGGAGYLGSILCRKLLAKGYQVRVLDNLMYGDEGIKDLYNLKKFEFVKGDMRDIQTVVEAVSDVDAVVHLAAIVGDPASALNPKTTIEINYLGTKVLAEVCKYSQINRFIFASTCSVYGASPTPETKINEDSSLHPVSLYAEMKLRSEQALLEIVDENFSPTIFRMATLYGLSPRMRFDLVVNTLAIRALKDKKYMIFGGDQWRPNLHVADAADAYIQCLETPIHHVRGQIINIGANEENYKIKTIGEIVKSLVPEADMIIDTKNVDPRNYNVSFDKMETLLQFHTHYTIKEGIKEIKKEVSVGKFSDYKDKKYSNYEYLLRNHMS